MSTTTINSGSPQGPPAGTPNLGANPPPKAGGDGAASGTWTVRREPVTSPLLSEEQLQGAYDTVYGLRHILAVAVGATSTDRQAAQADYIHATDDKFEAVGTVKARYGDLVPSVTMSPEEIAQRRVNIKWFDRIKGAMDEVGLEIGATALYRRGELGDQFDAGYSDLQTKQAGPPGSDDTRVQAAYGLMDAPKQDVIDKAVQGKTAAQKTTTHVNARESQLQADNAKLQGRVKDLEDMVARLQQQALLNGGAPDMTSDPAGPPSSGRRTTPRK